MVTIVTSLRSNASYIDDVESYFNASIILDENPFDSNLDRKIMKIIDGVTYKDGVVIKTKFGKTHIDKLSTGCKALLLINKYRNTEKVVNITECGDNVIKLIFELGEKCNIKIYTKRVIRMPNINKKCLFNDIEVNIGLDLYRKMVDKLE